MNASVKILLPVVAVAPVFPAVSLAQSNDAAYCQALVDKYEQYLDMSSKRGQQPQSVDARAGVEQCKAGNAAGIPAIEKALNDAKYDLPPRT